MAFRTLLIALLVSIFGHNPVCGFFTNRLSTVSCPEDDDVKMANPADCRKYYICNNGDPVEKICEKGAVFSNTSKECVPTLSDLDSCTMANAQRECEKGSVDLIPHPTACERYFNCSDNSPRHMYSLLAKYENECKYPDYFDINIRKCVSFKKAECGKERVGAKWVCDYLVNKCARSHCRPCSVDNPSCVGKENGVWPTVKIWSPFFTTCDSERSLNGEERCPDDEYIGHTQLFHPIKRQCLPLWEIEKKHGGYKPSCELKQPDYYEIEEMNIITYRCPGEEKFLCKPPFQLHNDLSKCKPLPLAALKKVRII